MRRRWRLSTAALCSRRLRAAVRLRPLGRWRATSSESCASKAFTRPALVRRVRRCRVRRRRARVTATAGAGASGAGADSTTDDCRSSGFLCATGSHCFGGGGGGGDGPAAGGDASTGSLGAVAVLGVRAVAALVASTTWSTPSSSQAGTEKSLLCPPSRRRRMLTAPEEAEAEAGEPLAGATRAVTNPSPPMYLRGVRSRCAPQLPPPLLPIEEGRGCGGWALRGDGLRLRLRPRLPERPRLRPRDLEPGCIAYPVRAHGRRQPASAAQWALLYRPGPSSHRRLPNLPVPPATTRSSSCTVYRPLDLSLPDHYIF